MVMRYTFWYGGYTVGDLQWLVEALQLLKRNEWKPETPLYFDGSGWADSVREAAAVSLLNALVGNQTAQTLFLQNADLDLKAQSALEQVFAKNDTLRIVHLKNLSSNGLAFDIPNGLFANQHLQELSLTKCVLHEQGCAGLARMLASKSRSLETLVLSQMDMTGGRLGMKHLAQAIKSCQSLKSFKLKGLQLARQERVELLQAIALNTSIQTLYLEDMQLDFDDAEAIAHLLARNKHIAEISLRRNNLDGPALHRIVEDGLCENETLVKLLLSDNPVGDDGASHLMQGLQEQKNTTLKQLCLINCDIWSEGCLAICQGLQRMRGLTHLSLDGNDMEEHAQELLEALQHNVYLERVLEGLRFLMKDSDDTETWKQIHVLLQCNQAKRRIVKEEQIDAACLPKILAGAARQQPDVLLSFLKSIPDCTRTAGQKKKKG